MNSDHESDFQPVVRRIPVKHPDGNCTCDGLSLEFNNQWFMQDINQYYQQVAYTPTGRVAKKQPKKPPKQPYTCPKGTMAQLQELLKVQGKDPISKDNLVLLEKAKKEFKIKNKAAVVSRDPRRYLREVFPAGEIATGVVVVEVGYAASIQALVEELGLVAEIVIAPINPKVIGQLRNVRLISSEAQGIKKAIRDKDESQKRMKEAIQKKKEQDKRAALAKCKDWDNWGREHWDENELTLRIYLEKTSKGSQMFAEFNFGVVKGVFRFGRQKDDRKATAAKQDPKKSKQKRKRDEFEEGGGRSGEYDNKDEDEYDRYGNRKRSPKPEAFYLGSIPQPSAKHQSWNYRWCGEDTMEIVIELYSDRKIYPMKFFGPRAEKLEGTFGCVKVSIGGVVDVNIAEAWADRNERAYERARVDRWH
ncbi:hypothetical protein N431DRAFT_549363 [Stipitochalara longipes BDJ]|nr:hypothetical protein N431DRAFT_549363 [Stipitochalara longipes BDJ]